MGRRRGNGESRTTVVIIATVVVVLIAALLGWKLWAIGEAAATKKAAERQAARLNVGRKAASPSGSATPSADTSGSSGATSASAESRPETLTVAAVGDMIFDRHVKDLVKSSGGTAPFTHVADDLAAADVTVGDLESMLSRRGSPDQAQSVTFQGDPDAIKGLTASGFDFLALANNHVLDYGPTALQDSIDALDQAGIGHAGAGADEKAAWQPSTFEKNGVKVAFFSFSHVVPDGYLATPDTPGLASGKLDTASVERAIRKASKTHDYVLVSFHWGESMVDKTSDQQVEAAHMAIDAGADMVLAHHPRVIQGVEFYKKRLIAYSLGDFVYDHTSRATGESFILHASLGPDGVANARAVPVYVSEKGRPDFVKGAEADTILKRLGTLSKSFGTNVKISGDEARLLP